MVRKNSNKILLFAIITAVVTLVSVFVFAGKVQAAIGDIFYIEDVRNMAVTIYYDSEKPEVSFIAPDETVYFEADLVVETDDNVICYYIPGAMIGQWRIDYDKKTNTELDVNWSPYSNQISITRLDFTPVGPDNRTELSFEVSCDVEGSFNYVIYAAIVDDDEFIGGQKEVISGTGQLNQPQTAHVRLSGLQTYNKYRFYLDAWRNDYDLETSDTALSVDSFSITNQDAPEHIENILTEVDLSENIITFDWSEYLVPCDEYVIGVFDPVDESEYLFANAFERDITQTIVSFTPDTQAIRVELSYIRNENTSHPLTKEIPLRTGAEFSFPQTDTVSAQQLSIGYNLSRSIHAVIRVNENEQQIALSGSGSFSISLDELDNEIVLRYWLDDENTVYTMRKLLSVDSTAPILLLPENDVTLYVENDTFDLAGATEADCTVTVNDDAVAMKSDGTFVHELSLLEGDNEFIVRARDPAGNMASQLIVIHKLKPGAGFDQEEVPLWRTYIPLIGSFIAGLFLLLFVSVSTRIYGKNRKISRLFAISELLRGVFLLCFVIAATATGFCAWKYLSLENLVESGQLFDLAKQSMENAYKIIEQYELFRKFLRLGIFASAIMLVLFIGLMFLSRFLRRRALTVGSAAGSDGGSDSKLADEGQPPPQRLTEEADAFVCRHCGATYAKPVRFCGKCGKEM